MPMMRTSSAAIAILPGARFTLHHPWCSPARSGTQPESTAAYPTRQPASPRQCRHRGTSCPESMKRSRRSSSGTGHNTGRCQVRGGRRAWRECAPDSGARTHRGGCRSGHTNRDKGRRSRCRHPRTSGRIQPQPPAATRTMTLTTRPADVVRALVVVMGVDRGDARGSTPRTARRRSVRKDVHAAASLIAWAMDRSTGHPCTSNFVAHAIPHTSCQ